MKEVGQGQHWFTLDESS